MSGALKMIGISLTAAMLAMTLRPVSRQAGAAVAVAAGTMLFFYAVTRMAEGARGLYALAGRAGVSGASLQTIVKMLGITYLTEFAAGVCRDAGEDGLSDKVAMGGKALLFSLTLPLLREIAETALALVP